RPSGADRRSEPRAGRLGLRRIGVLWPPQSMGQGAGWTDPRVRAGDSSVEGSGLYAAAPIRAGEVVFVWGGGTVISDSELQAIATSGRRYSSAAISENQHILWSAEDPNAGGPGGANHSCGSNLWMLDERTLGARR